MVKRDDEGSSPAAYVAAGGDQGARRPQAERAVLEKLMDFASRLYRQGQVEAAMELWNEAMAIDDTEPRLLNDFGRPHTPQVALSTREKS
jgi:hypothetical protein